MKTCASCSRTSRRDFLAGAGAFGALAALARRGDAGVRVELADVALRSTAKAVIFVNLMGAPSQLDTFDPKEGPWNPNDADLQPLGGGLVLSRKLFPQLSRFGSDLLLLHNVSSWEAAHERGQFYIQTAHQANPAFVAETPNIGSVVSHERTLAGVVGKLPAFMALDGGGGGGIQGATFLGGRHEPLDAPTGSFDTIRHDYFGNDSQRRFGERFGLLKSLEAPVVASPSDPLLTRHIEFYDAARPLMYDPAVEAVFQINGEERSRYGNNQFGNACVVARNAVRAKLGVAFIQITNGGWDTHQSMFDRSSFNSMYRLTEVLDRGVGMLVEDLKASGDLAQTLIIIMGEFGRTPGPLNASGGRDHHRDVMPVAMLGGGVKGGRALGASDSQGARVVEPGWSKQRPIFPEDLTATIYSALGINWTKRILETPTGRIFQYVDGASFGTYTSVDEVFG